MGNGDGSMSLEHHSCDTTPAKVLPIPGLKRDEEDPLGKASGYSQHPSALGC